MMYWYLLLDLTIILPPLAGLYFYRAFWTPARFFAALLATLPVGAVFICWDVLAILRGDWYFNSRYILHFRIGQLPVEEVLFFVVVPVACMFIFAAVEYIYAKKRLAFPRSLLLGASLIFLVLSFLVTTKHYTSVVFLFTAATCLLLWFDRSLSQSKGYWVGLLLTYLGFYSMNFLLTALPILSYNPHAILGIRILTIPLEDHWYSFVLVTWNYWLYRRINQLPFIQQME